MTPKQAERLSDDELAMSVDDVDVEIGSRGEQIAKLVAEQRKHLEVKDTLVLEQTRRIRSGSNLTLGDDTDG